MKQPYSRRHFLKQSALTAGALPLFSTDLLAQSRAADEGLPPIHIFSKHLQFLDYADMADAAANMGFKGVELTVRPEGHVLPERVENDLPKAVDALKKVGFSPDLMTTTVGDASEPISIRVLTTAARLGFGQYRTKWYPYPEKQTIPDAIKQFQQQLRGLGELNKSLHLTGCYQNHAGLWAGASIWELWQMLQTANPQFMGVQYDIRHAMVEGGMSWSNGLKLIHPHIKSLTMKDFVWAKKDGKWAVQDVPFGEGMVDFTTYFRLLKQYQVKVPITLHVEYPLGGADQGAKKLTISKNQVFEALKRDLNRLKELWLAA
jgi:sugar phosphate isomerase/epimerase